MVRAKGYNASIKYQLVDYLSRFGKFAIGSTILASVKTRFLPQTLTFLFFTYSTWGSSMGYFDIGILGVPLDFNRVLISFYLYSELAIFTPISI